jgi:hypothetical protein
LTWWKLKSWSTRLLLVPSSHSRKERITRGRTHSTYLIGGSQTVQRCQDSRTFCVQYWPTHPTLTHLIVTLASSIRLTMTIRTGLTPNTLNNRWSRRLTNEYCSSRVSRYWVKGRNGWRDWEDDTCMKLTFDYMWEDYWDMDLKID